MEGRASALPYFTMARTNKSIFSDPNTVDPDLTPGADGMNRGHGAIGVNTGDVNTNRSDGKVGGNTPQLGYRGEFAFSTNEGDDFRVSQATGSTAPDATFDELTNETDTTLVSGDYSWGRGDGLLPSITFGPQTSTGSDFTLNGADLGTYDTVLEAVVSTGSSEWGGIGGGGGNLGYGVHTYSQGSAFMPHFDHNEVFERVDVRFLILTNTQDSQVHMALEFTGNLDITGVTLTTAFTVVPSGATGAVYYTVTDAFNEVLASEEWNEFGDKGEAVFTYVIVPDDSSGNATGSGAAYFSYYWRGNDIRLGRASQTQDLAWDDSGTTRNMQVINYLAFDQEDLVNSDDTKVMRVEGRTLQGGDLGNETKYLSQDQFDLIDGGTPVVYHPSDYGFQMTGSDGSFISETSDDFTPFSEALWGRNRNDYISDLSGIGVVSLGRITYLETKSYLMGFCLKRTSATHVGGWFWDVTSDTNNLIHIQTDLVTPEMQFSLQIGSSGIQTVALPIASVAADVTHCAFLVWDHESQEFTGWYQEDDDTPATTADTAVSGTYEARLSFGWRLDFNPIYQGIVTIEMDKLPTDWEDACLWMSRAWRNGYKGIYPGWRK